MTIIAILSIGYLGFSTFNVYLDSQEKLHEIPQQVFDTTHIEICDKHQMIYDTTKVIDTITAVVKVRELIHDTTKHFITIIDTITYIDTIPINIIVKDYVFDTIAHEINFIKTVFDTITYKKKQQSVKTIKLPKKNEVKVTPVDRKKIDRKKIDGIPPKTNKLSTGWLAFGALFVFVLCMLISSENNSAGCLIIGFCFLIVAIFFWLISF
jgi:hypothetical protein